MSTKKVLLWSGCGLLLVFLCCTGVVGVGAWLVTGGMQRSDFVGEAMAILEAHPEAREALGPPIHQTGGSIQLHYDWDQSGDISLHLEGTRRKGTLVVRGSRGHHGDRWLYTTFYLDMPVERIDLLEFANGSVSRLTMPEPSELIEAPTAPTAPGAPGDAGADQD